MVLFCVFSFILLISMFCVLVLECFVMFGGYCLICMWFVKGIKWGVVC